MIRGLSRKMYELSFFIGWYHASCKARGLGAFGSKKTRALVRACPFAWRIRYQQPGRRKKYNSQTEKWNCEKHRRRRIELCLSSLFPRRRGCWFISSAYLRRRNRSVFMPLRRCMAYLAGTYRAFVNFVRIFFCLLSFCARIFSGTL